MIITCVDYHETIRDYCSILYNKQNNTWMLGNISLIGSLISHFENIYNYLYYNGCLYILAKQRAQKTTKCHEIQKFNYLYM